MAIHPGLSNTPYDILPPAQRWFPADEALRESSYEKLLPPLVAKIREDVAARRATGCAGASHTSRALLKHWLETEHLTAQAAGTTSVFLYYFAQREAVETVIWLYDVKQARDKSDLMRFDASGSMSASMSDEAWTRYVVKMATGSGETNCWDERGFVVYKPQTFAGLAASFRDYQ